MYMYIYLGLPIVDLRILHQFVTLFAVDILVIAIMKVIYMYIYTAVYNYMYTLWLSLNRRIVFIENR